jgi:membrane protein YqaA with SNARE-associated domain
MDLADFTNGISMQNKTSIFAKLYDICIKWASHRHAERYLSLMTLLESIFFPIPPDVMLAPMVLSQQEKAFRYAFITTISSVIGGAIGYLLGMMFFEPLVLPFVEAMGYQDKLTSIKEMFNSYGVWIVLLAGFTPIPFKLFTVTSGMMALSFWPFMLASTIGRGARFYLVAGILYIGGKKMENTIRRYIDICGWLVIIAIAVLIVYKNL